jgi:hypothetical protein
MITGRGRQQRPRLVGRQRRSSVVSGVPGAAEDVQAAAVLVLVDLAPGVPLGQDLFGSLGAVAPT